MNLNMSSNTLDKTDCLDTGRKSAVDVGILTLRI